MVARPWAHKESMYDSDEVRDAVRRDALDTFVQRTGAFQGFADLPPLDQAAISEALAARGNPWQPVLRDYLSSLEYASQLLGGLGRRGQKAAE